VLEEGVVGKIDGKGKASVELERGSSCKSCCACSQVADGKMMIEAANPIEAQPGDKVRLYIETKGFLLGIVMLYLLPALGLFLGIIVGSRADSDYIGILLGLILMFILFVGARHYGKRNISYSARIVEII